MADVAKDAVFVKSDALTGDEHTVAGPKAYGQHEMASIVDGLLHVGFQATNFGKAATLMRAMMEARRDIQSVAASWPEDSEENAPSMRIFVGVTANLFGTGCREALKFLVKHRLVDALVVTGGGPEHDIRRTVSPSCYHVHVPSTVGTSTNTQTDSTDHHGGRFGNVTYAKSDKAYKDVLTRILADVCERQRHAFAASSPSDDTCAWSWGPSDIWRHAGLMLPSLVPNEVAETSVLYWAARNDIPVYSPSFTDGDVMDIVEDPIHKLSLKVDLVADIHRLNKSAMASTKTGMIILGGGVAKHHVCNANLMRNGADFAVFINNAQEFDGSDGGARPDEAVSWGKIRLDGQSVKIYAEISSVWPLLVAHTCVPFLRS